MRVVASLTTLPGRYRKLSETLISLNNQDYKLDAIYLGIPLICRRLKTPYPPLPDYIIQQCTVVDITTDYGPCSKIVAGLLEESDPETCIITFDDDFYYPPDTVSNLVKWAKLHPDKALGPSGVLIKLPMPFISWVSNRDGDKTCFTGFKVPKCGRNVDILCGFTSVLYRRYFFPDNTELESQFLRYPLEDKDVYLNDDVMISAYLSGRKITRLIVPGFHSNVECRDSGKCESEKSCNMSKYGGNEVKGKSKTVGNTGGVKDNSNNALSSDRIAFIRKFKNAVEKTKEWGFFQEPEPVGYDETIGGKSIMILTFVVMLVVVFVIYVVYILKGY